jgi:hypothetical protein
MTGQPVGCVSLAAMLETAETSTGQATNPEVPVSVAQETTSLDLTVGQATTSFDTVRLNNPLGVPRARQSN